MIKSMIFKFALLKKSKLEKNDNINPFLSYPMFHNVSNVKAYILASGANILALIHYLNVAFFFHPQLLVRAYMNIKDSS